MESKISNKREACINSLKSIITGFINGERNLGVTRVIPLVIPTGWGKTSIVLKSVLTKTNNHGEQNRITIVLWPKNFSQVKGVWRKDKNLPPRYQNDNWDWKHLSGDESSFNSDYQKYIGYVNDSDRNNSGFSIGGEGNVIFIVDEWHSKGLFESIDENNIENSIRNIFLPPTSKRNLLVLLVSATPISLVKEMKKDEDDSFQDKENIHNQMKIFSELVKIGNQGNREYEFFIFKDIFIEEIEKLKATRAKYEKMLIYNPNKEEWAKEYINVLHKIDETKKKNIRNNEPFSFSRIEQEIITQEIITDDKNSLKILTLKNFLCSEENKTRNFVIFCFHNNVAKKLKDILTNLGVIGTIDLKMKEDDFNNIPTSPEERKILILTNKSSEGLSLHRSGAWIIHYELDWNPIRIIQRFGRVWRLIDGKEARELKKSGKCFEKKNLPSEDSKKDLFLTDPVAFYIPYTYSMEEEKLKRLKKRWKYLEKDADSDVDCTIKIKDTLVPMDIALGIRLTPSVL